MSYFNYFQVANQYRLLPCGGALGRGCGPLLISNDAQYKIEPSTKIAVPGMNTTATFLLKFFLPSDAIFVPMTFDTIEDAILSGKVDAGVIIHENRFTYAQRGLQLIQDLGKHWEETTLAPIPLGCLAINRRLPESIDETIIKLVQQSIQYAQNNTDQLMPFILSLAQAMTEEVVQAHIDLYVNDFSFHIGPDGQRAIDRMQQIMQAPEHAYHL